MTDGKRSRQRNQNLKITANDILDFCGHVRNAEPITLR